MHLLSSCLAFATLARGASAGSSTTTCGGREVAPTSSSKLVYNRVSKAGSDALVNVLRAVSATRKRRRASAMVVHQAPHPYMPNASAMARDIARLPPGSVYVNHAGMVRGDESLAWMNMVREPLDRLASDFYYAVDVGLRGARAEAELEARKADPRCGCFALEFDDCVRTMAENGCDFDARWPLRATQLTYFCPARDADVTDAAARERCTADLAAARVRSRYAFVGLVDEFALSVDALEALLPEYFGGAAAIAPSIPHHPTEIKNPATNTSENGAISSIARRAFKGRWSYYDDEAAFYEAAKRLFWCKVGALGLIKD